MRRYERSLSRLTREIATLVRAALRPHLVRARAREDADIDPASFLIDFGTLLLEVRRLVDRRMPRIVGRWLEDVAGASNRDIARVLRISPTDQSLGVQQALRVAADQNVRLISSIPDRLLDDVQRLVSQSAQDGTRVEVLARQIEDRFSVTQSRARLIARDQTLKANSALTQARHREAGVTEYIWDASGDSRVRDMHAELDGRVFRWDDPPITNEQGERNHPGEDYQCRCVARPNLRRTESAA
mgnify:CR=1 FL=1